MAGPELLERGEELRTAPVPTSLHEGDEALVRRELRRQIATMERELGGLLASAFPRGGIEWGAGTGAWGPRLLSTRDLEATRDRLDCHLRDVRGRLHSIAYAEERNRELVEDMLADPGSHKWVQISNEDVGEPGCRHWHSRPRWGILGMLMGWWRVRISSGCPLATGRGPRSAPRPDGPLVAQAA